MLLDTLHYGSKPSAGVSFRAMGREILAEREALIVDEIDDTGRRLSHFWIDDRTGLTLRKVYYSKDEPDVPVSEISVQSIAYDIDFPQDLLDERQPWRGDFAQDYTGIPIVAEANASTELVGREHISFQNLPENFDPSQSRLTFQSYNWDQLQDNEIPIRVLVDQYFTGVTTIIDPWTMICDRSPDGMKVAFVSKPKDFSSSSYLFLVNLNNENDNRPFLHMSVTQFAFAPDSHRLAIFGRTSAGKPGILILLDTESGDRRVLLTPSDASSLVWSPDGERLALMARYQADSFEDYVVVINTYSGVVEYSESIDYARRPGNPWPVAAWGVEFPVEMGGLEACAKPPAARQNP
jgi:hypothetical protein